MARTPNDTQWSEHLASCVQFVSLHGRLPSATSTDPDERRLGVWYRNQLGAMKRGDMPEKRVQLILTSELLQQQTKRKPVTLGLPEVTRFIEEKGRLPRQTAEREEERHAYRWLYTQARSRSESLNDPDLVKAVKAAKQPRSFVALFGSLLESTPTGQLSGQSQLTLKHAQEGAESGRLEALHGFLLDVFIPGWRTQQIGSESRTESGEAQLQATIDKLADELSVVEAIDAGRRSDLLSPHIWFVSHHLGELPGGPTVDQVRALEEHLGRPVDLTLELPLTRLVKASKRAEHISLRDSAWCEQALKVAQYRLRRGRWPKQVGDRKKYREMFDLERAKPEPRKDILAEEISDEVIDLGYWLREQRRLDMLGKMREDRALFLDEIAPDWRKRKFRRKSFDENLLMVAAFVQRNNRWPAQRKYRSVLTGVSAAEHDRELHLAHVIKKWRADHKKEVLPVSQAMEIERLFGGNWHLATLPPLQPPEKAVEELRERLKQAATD